MSCACECMRVVYLCVCVGVYDFGRAGVRALPGHFEGSEGRAQAPPRGEGEGVPAEGALVRPSVGGGGGGF